MLILQKNFNVKQYLMKIVAYARSLLGRDVTKYLQGYPSGSFDPFKYVGIVILFVLSNEEASLVRFFCDSRAFFPSQQQLVACPPTLVLTSQGNRVLVAKFDSLKDQNTVLAKTNEDHLHPFRWNRAQAHNFVPCYVRVIQYTVQIFELLKWDLIPLWLEFYC